MIRESTTIIVVFIVLFICCNASGLRCLQCSDVIEPRHCHVITYCAENEDCVVEKFQIETGETLYNVGCKSKKLCGSSRSAITKQEYHSPHYKAAERNPRILCTECCSNKDICNSEGCGAIGYPQSAGPTCFNCQQIRNPTKCDVIMTCSGDEHCFIEELREFDDTYYRTKCLPSHECKLQAISEIVGRKKRNVPHINKRSVSCSSCCDNNLCNNQCPTNDTWETTTEISPTKVTMTPATTDSHSTPKASKFGTEYMVGFLTNYLTNRNYQLVISSETSVTAEVYTAYDNLTRILSSKSGVVHLNLTDFVIGRNIVERKSIYIKSNSSIFVNGYSNADCCFNDAYSAIPVNDLGTEYFVVSTRNNGEHNEIGIVAVYDNTTITFDLKMSTSLNYAGQVYHNGDKLNVQMNRFETFQLSYQQNNESMNNMKVTGNKPFVVYSGNDCGYVNAGHCTYMIESIPPVSALGATYIIPQFKKIHPPSGFIKMTLLQQTNIILYNTTGNTYSGKYVVTDSLYLDKTIIVQGSSPFMLTLYGSFVEFGENFMLNIPPTCHYSNKYVISTPTIKSFRNFISLVIPRNVSNQLLFNTSLSFSTLSSITLQSGVEWVTLSAEIPAGKFVITHPDPSVTFGVIQYGYKIANSGQTSNYAFPVYTDLSFKASCAHS